MGEEVELIEQLREWAQIVGDNIPTRSIADNKLSSVDSRLLTEAGHKFIEAATTLERVERERDEALAAAEAWERKAVERMFSIVAAEAQVDAMRKAAIRVRARCQGMRLDADASAALNDLDAALRALSAPAEESGKGDIASRDHERSPRASLEPGDLDWLRSERFDWMIDDRERYASRPKILADSDFMVSRIDRLIAALASSTPDAVDELLKEAAVALGRLKEEAEKTWPWPYGFYDSHTAIERLETLAQLFGQPVDGKLSGRVSIGDPQQAAADIRGVLAALASSTPEKPNELADFIRDQVCCPRIHGCELGGAEECPAERVRAALNGAGSTQESGVYPEWRPIETAPKDGTTVLILVGEVVSQANYQGPSDGAIYSGSAGRYNWFCETSCRSIHDLNVTHWMPLPTAPAEARGDQPEGGR